MKKSRTNQSLKKIGDKQTKADFAVKQQPSLEEIFAKYPLSDDFAYTPEDDALYTELTGAIIIHIETYGI
ncbi:MAG: DUF1896 family protein [Bacteroidales bacterium]|nr:DUF1896 family protein [Bacteroidales bacterium]